MSKKKHERREFLKYTLAASAASISAVACAGKHAPSGRDAQDLAAPAVNILTDASVHSNKSELVAYMRGLKIIDAHEHTLPEHRRLEKPADVLKLLGTYCRNDFISAGRKSDIDYANADIPLEKRWESIAPHLDQIKELSHYRATKIALKDFYGVEDLNETNYREVSERINADNTPGLYHRIFRDRCGIKVCLVQPIVSRGHLDDLEPSDLLKPVFAGYAAWRPHVPPFREELEQKYDVKITDLDLYLETLTQFLKDLKRQGTVAVKTYATHWTLTRPDMKAARGDFLKVLKGQPTTKLLEETIRDHVFGLAVQWDWPVSVHGGGAYFDFRKFDPRIFIDVITRYPDNQFDLFHLGLPFPRQFTFIAKQFPNVNLNLTWCCLLSESLGRQSINEIIDSVPINKVTAFGGDYYDDVENVYGHLEITREVLAEALTERIARGRIDLDGARRIAQLWFHDNPATFYRLNV